MVWNRRCLIGTNVQFCSRICYYEGTGNKFWTRYKWHPPGVTYSYDVNLIGDDIRMMERGVDVSLNACKDIG
jgi:hypothetical protein